MMMPLKTIIEFKGLSIGYNKKALAEDINLSLNQSGLFTLIGLNGSGKSTLLKTILGKQAPLNGAITVNGLNFNSYTSKDLAKVISVVYSRLEVVEHFTARELISLGRTPYTGLIGNLSKDDEEIVNTAIESCKLNNLANTPCSHLSDGELQKVLIARALAQDTPVLLLDEPTSHLDALNRMSVLLLLKKIAAKQNKLIILSSHDISLCLQMADEVWLLTNKSLIAAPPDEMIKNDAFLNSFVNENMSFDENTYSFIINK